MPYKIKKSLRKERRVGELKSTLQLMISERFGNVPDDVLKPKNY